MLKLQTIINIMEDITMKKLIHKHPGQILNDYFITDMKITPYKLAKETKMSPIRVSEILKGKRSVTVNTALRLSKFFGNTFQFWMNLQNAYDKDHIKKNELNKILQIHPYKAHGSFCNKVYPPD